LRFATVLSDKARKEAEDVLDGNLPFPAMMSSIDQLKTDFANRHQSYADQITAIQGRLKGGQANNAAPAVPPNVAKALGNVGSGRHKLSDGSVWDKQADGTITKVQWKWQTETISNRSALSTANRFRT
jgi:hypothetical protein